MKIFLTIIILLNLNNQFRFEFIDNPIIYSGIYDPSHINGLPKDLIDSFMSERQNSFEYTNNNFLRRKQHSCKDPNENKLMSQLTKFYLENIQLFYVSFSSFNNSPSLRRNDTDNCTENTNIGNGMPVCPWHQNTIERTDKYPFKRMTAICNCKSKCLIEDQKSKNYKCMPISIQMPMLARGRCHNGLFEWKNEIENVDVFCACIKY